MAVAASEAACRGFSERGDFIQENWMAPRGSPQTLNRDMLVKLTLSSAAQASGPRREFGPSRVVGPEAIV